VKENTSVVLLIGVDLFIVQVMVSHFCQVRREEVTDDQKATIYQEPVYFGDRTEKIGPVYPVKHEVDDDEVKQLL
jgi:hypothetical protein